MADGLQQVETYLGDEPLNPELEAEIDAALEVARNSPPPPMARTAQFVPGVRLLLICLKSGQRLAFPVEDLEDIKDATDDDLSDIELLGPGTAIHFTRFGHGVYVPALVEGVYGSEMWMKQLVAKRNAALRAA